MRIVYADDCRCADVSLRPSWFKPTYLPRSESKVVRLWNEAMEPLIRDFDSTTNEQRYFAFHIDGWHVLHVES